MMMMIILLLLRRIERHLVSNIKLNQFSLWFADNCEWKALLSRIKQATTNTDRTEFVLGRLD